MIEELSKKNRAVRTVLQNQASNCVQELKKRIENWKKTSKSVCESTLSLKQQQKRNPFTCNSISFHESLDGNDFLCLKN